MNNKLTGKELQIVITIGSRLAWHALVTLSDIQCLGPRNHLFPTYSTYHSVSKGGEEDPLVEVDSLFHPASDFGTLRVQFPLLVVGVGDIGGDGHALRHDKLVLLQGRDLSQWIDLDEGGSVSEKI